jgi:hypothetical protein
LRGVSGDAGSTSGGCYVLTYVGRVNRRIPSATVETITVTDVRVVLPSILARLKRGGRDAAPILIGRHREPMAVLISIEQFYEYCSLVVAALDAAEAGRAGNRTGPWSGTGTGTGTRTGTGTGTGTRTGTRTGTGTGTGTRTGTGTGTGTRTGTGTGTGTRTGTGTCPEPGPGTGPGTGTGTGPRPGSGPGPGARRLIGFRCVGVAKPPSRCG